MVSTGFEAGIAWFMAGSCKENDGLTRRKGRQAGFAWGFEAICKEINFVVIAYNKSNPNQPHAGWKYLFGGLSYATYSYSISH